MTQVTPEQQTPNAEARKAPLLAKVGLVGGTAIALAAGIYMDKHEVQTPEEAVFSISAPFSNETLTHVDSQEIPVGIVGLGGIVAAVISLEDIRTNRRRR